MFNSGIKSLYEIISGDPQFKQLNILIKESEVISKFYDIFPELSKVAVPVKVVKKSLHLKVENAAWRSELKFQEQKVIEKINNFFKDNRIKYLKLFG
jgi:hypothetical protein